MAFTTKAMEVEEVDEFLEGFGADLDSYTISAYHQSGTRKPRVVVSVRHEEVLDTEDSWYF